MNACLNQKQEDLSSCFIQDQSRQKHYKKEIIAKFVGHFKGSESDVVGAFCMIFLFNNVIIIDIKWI